MARQCPGNPIAKLYIGGMVLASTLAVKNLQMRCVLLRTDWSVTLLHKIEYLSWLLVIVIAAVRMKTNL